MKTTARTLTFAGVPVALAALAAASLSTRSNDAPDATIIPFSHESGLASVAVVVPGPSQPLTVFGTGVNEFGLVSHSATVVHDPAAELEMTSEVWAGEWACSLTPTVGTWSQVTSEDDVQVAWWPILDDE